MFKRYYSFFPLLSVVLLLRNVSKKHFDKPKWGVLHKQRLRGKAYFSQFL